MLTIDALFVGLTLVYLLFGAKVDEWITISGLGFKMETSQGFLDHPKIYDLIRTMLFIAACACLLDTKWIPSYAGAIILVAAWLTTTWLGQRRAFTTFRKMCKEGAQRESLADHKAFFETMAQKSNAELRDQLHSPWNKNWIR